MESIRAKEKESEGIRLIAQKPQEELTKYKVCKTCYEEKPLSDFPARNRSVDGHRHHCKECYSKKRKAERIKREVGSPSFNEIIKEAAKEVIREYLLKGDSHE